MNLNPRVSIALALLVAMATFFWYITMVDGNPPDLYTNVQPTQPQTPHVLPYITWSPPAAGDHVVTAHPLVDRP